MAFRTAVLVLAFVALAQAAFVPTSSSQKAFVVSSSKTSSQLEFGFLKDLGLEKPSWLPDFGEKKEEEPAAAAAEESAPTDGEDTTTATETDDAPAEEAVAKED